MGVISGRTSSIVTRERTSEICHKGTKTQSRTKLLIPTAYVFVLLRVFVSLWLFHTLLDSEGVVPRHMNIRL